MGGALILTGAPGSGKSSVLDELSTRLEIAGVRFGAIETEQFARGWPWLTAAEWMPQLAAVIDLQRQLGREHFLVVATTETEQELRDVIDTVAAKGALVVCLSAAPDVLARRVADREPDSWPGKGPLIDHARSLAGQIPRLAAIDAIFRTDERRAAQVADEVMELLTARQTFGPD